MSIEQVAVELTLQQVQAQLASRVIGLVVSLFLTGIGLGLGTKAKNEVARFIGFILALLSAIGLLAYIQLITESVSLLSQIA